ncbi:MAG: MFS transporter [Candidatus Competibacteraceae bacterium]|nr:MAG: MFS transporter [Candidatus Competibacteraceae bacterium]
MLGLSGTLTAAAATVWLPRGADEEAERRAATNPPLASSAFWVFAAIAVLYAFAEGTFSNWAVLYLSEAKALPAGVAALALSVFWAAIVMGRLLVAVLVARVAPLKIWLTLPALMIAAFLLLPAADTPALGLSLFALAGLACSAFFPLTISLASERFPEHVPWISSMLIAALMVGVGLGSFVIGPLREWLALEQIYRLSAFYPLAVIGLAVWLVADRRQARVEARV